MKKQYLTFLLLVTILLAIETGFLVFMVKFAHVDHHPKFLLVVALVYLLLIPSNIYVSWKMALAGRESGNGPC